jgi:hypothetical protein
MLMVGEATVSACARLSGTSKVTDRLGQGPTRDRFTGRFGGHRIAAEIAGLTPKYTSCAAIRVLASTLSSKPQSAR